MKRDLISRLGKIEADGVHHGGLVFGFCRSIPELAIIAVHFGGWTPGERVETAAARALDMQPGELSRAIVEAGDPIHDRIIAFLHEASGHGRAEAFDDLYAQIPHELKASLRLLPVYPDYRL